MYVRYILARLPHSYKVTVEAHISVARLEASLALKATLSEWSGSSPRKGSCQSGRSPCYWKGCKWRLPAIHCYISSGDLCMGLMHHYPCSGPSTLLLNQSMISDRL